MVPIYGFVHVATMTNWQHVLAEQVELIRRSGLRDRCGRIDFCKVGSGDYPLPWAIDQYDVGEFEFPTIARLYDNAQVNDGYSFYIHLKGVSKTPEHWEKHKLIYQDFAGLDSLESLRHNERLWRKYLEYFAIERHEDCIIALEDHDICGVEWRDKPHPHYSGNFWWARNDYIRRLVHPTDFREQHRGYRDILGSDRSLAEFWVGSGSPKVKVLHNAGLNLYHVAIQPSSYKNTKLF